MPTRRKPQLTETIPATPCTPQMRERVLEIADNEGTSIAEVTRKAITFYLSKINSKPIAKNSKRIKKNECSA